MRHRPLLAVPPDVVLLPLLALLDDALELRRLEDRLGQVPVDKRGSRPQHVGHSRVSGFGYGVWDFVIWDQNGDLLKDLGRRVSVFDTSHDHPCLSFHI